MSAQRFPQLDPEDFAATRDALHTYAKILGAWMSACRERRKHWWQASLRPSLTGATTDVIYADSMDFELELNLRESELVARTARGEQLTERLHGQPAAEVAAEVRTFLTAAGVSEEQTNAVDGRNSADSEIDFPGYSSQQANKLGRALSATSAALSSFRSGIREETSPIGIWPHHFDLAMLWLPGDKVAGQDPDNEEYSDRQMNFGFTFGDEGIPEPYFYVTAYPQPESFATLELPAGTQWQTEGFSGAVLRYHRLLEEKDPATYLQRLWTNLINHSRKRL